MLRSLIFTLGCLLCSTLGFSDVYEGGWTGPGDLYNFLQHRSSVMPRGPAYGDPDLELSIGVMGKQDVSPVLGVDEPGFHTCFFESADGDVYYGSFSRVPNIFIQNYTWYTRLLVKASNRAIYGTGVGGAAGNPITLRSNYFGKKLNGDIFFVNADLDGNFVVYRQLTSETEVNQVATIASPYSLDLSSLTSTTTQTQGTYTYRSRGMNFSGHSLAQYKLCVAPEGNNMALIASYIDPTPGSGTSEFFVTFSSDNGATWTTFNTLLSPQPMLNNNSGSENRIPEFYITYANGGGSNFYLVTERNFGGTVAITLFVFTNAGVVVGNDDLNNFYQLATTVTADPSIRILFGLQGCIPLGGGSEGAMLVGIGNSAFSFEGTWGAFIDGTTFPIPITYQEFGSGLQNSLAGSANNTSPFGAPFTLPKSSKVYINFPRHPIGVFTVVYEANALAHICGFGYLSGWADPDAGGNGIPEITDVLSNPILSTTDATTFALPTTGTNSPLSVPEYTQATFGLGQKYGSDEFYTFATSIATGVDTNAFSFQIAAGNPVVVAPNVETPNLQDKGNISPPIPFNYISQVKVERSSDFRDYLFIARSATSQTNCINDILDLSVASPIFARDPTGAKTSNFFGSRLTPAFIHFDLDRSEQVGSSYVASLLYDFNNLPGSGNRLFEGKSCTINSTTNFPTPVVLNIDIPANDLTWDGNTGPLTIPSSQNEYNMYSAGSSPAAPTPLPPDYPTQSSFTPLSPISPFTSAGAVDYITVNPPFDGSFDYVYMTTYFGPAQGTPPLPARDLPAPSNSGLPAEGNRSNIVQLPAVDAFYVWDRAVSTSPDTTLITENRPVGTATVNYNFTNPAANYVSDDVPSPFNPYEYTEFVLPSTTPGIGNYIVNATSDVGPTDTVNYAAPLYVDDNGEEITFTALDVSSTPNQITWTLATYSGTPSNISSLRFYFVDTTTFDVTVGVHTGSPLVSPFDYSSVGLSPGSAYNVYVTGVDTITDPEHRQTAATFAGPLTILNNLNLTDNCLPYAGNKDSTISWDPVGAATGYNVYVSDTPLNALNVGTDALLVTLVPTIDTSFNYTDLRNWAKSPLTGNVVPLYLYVTYLDGVGEYPDPATGPMVDVRIEVIPGPAYEDASSILELQAKHLVGTATEYTMYNALDDSVLMTIDTGSSSYPDFDYGTFLPEGVTHVYIKATSSGGTVEESCASPTYHLFVPADPTTRLPNTPYDVYSLCEPTDKNPLIRWKPGQGSTSSAIYVSESDVTDLTSVSYAVLETGYKTLFYDYTKLREVIAASTQPNGPVATDAASYYFYIQSDDPLPPSPAITNFGSGQKTEVSPGPTISDGGAGSITWPAITGAVEYVIYITPDPASPGGLPVFAASTTSTSFDYTTLKDSSGNPLTDPTRLGVAVGDGNSKPISCFSYLGVNPGSPGTIAGVGEVSNGCNIGAGPLIDWAPAGSATSYNLYISEVGGANFQLLDAGVQSLFYFTGNIRQEIDDLPAMTLPSDLANYTIYIQSNNGGGSVPATVTGPSSFTGGPSVDQITINPSIEIIDDPATTTLTWTNIQGVTQYDLYVFGSPTPLRTGISSPFNYFGLFTSTIVPIVINPSMSACPSQAVSLYSPPATDITDECTPPPMTPDPRITWTAAPGATGYQIAASNGSDGQIFGNINPGLNSEVLPDGASGGTLTGTEYNYMDEPEFSNESLRTIVSGIPGSVVDPLEPQFFLYVFATNGTLTPPVPPVPQGAAESVSVLVSPGPDLSLGSGTTIDWFDLQSTTGVLPVTVTDYQITYTGPLSNSATVSSPGSAGDPVSWNYSMHLTDPGTYQVYVQWMDASLNLSCQSTIEIEIPVQPPGLVSNLEDTCMPPTKQITWNAGVGATGYRIYVSDSSTTTVTAGNADQIVNLTTDLFYDYSNIRNVVGPNATSTNYRYFLYVQSVDGVNPDKPALGSSGWDEVVIPINPGPEITNNIGGLKVEWPALVGPVDGYIVNYQGFVSGSDTVPQPMGSTVEWNYSGLMAGTYTVTVSWYNANVPASCPSNEITIEIPDPIPGLASNFEDSCILDPGDTPKITWDPAPGATEYNIYAFEFPQDPVPLGSIPHETVTTEEYDYSTIRMDLMSSSGPIYLYVQSSDGGVHPDQPVLGGVAGQWPLVEVKVAPPITITLNTGSQQVTWGTFNNVDHYEVTYTGPKSDTVNHNSSPWNYSSVLTDPGTYQITVSLVSDGTPQVTSCDSNIVEVTIDPPPPINNPEGVTFARDRMWLQEDIPGAHYLVWRAPSNQTGVTGYNVYYSDNPAGTNKVLIAENVQTTGLFIPPGQPPSGYFIVVTVTGTGLSTGSTSTIAYP